MAFSSPIPTYLPIWQQVYSQIRPFLETTAPSSEWSRPLTPFEEMCLKKVPQRHLVSYTYALLFSDQNPKNKWTNSKWEQDLSINLSDTEWETIYTITHKGSLNIYAQKNYFKLLPRWYRTPLILHLIYPTVSPHCWRCGTEMGSLLHIWWTCPKIQPFWKEVHRIIHQITTYSLDYTPA